MKKVKRSKNTYIIPYGSGELKFFLPEGIEATVVEPHSSIPLDNLKGAVKKTIGNPLGSPRLKDIAKPTDKCCIVVTDATRACPDGIILLPLIEELKMAGVKDDNITVLIGLGVHRPMTPQEKVKKFGSAIIDRYKILDHDAFNAEGLINIGEHNGVPLSVNSIAYEADILISTGIVEPHQYAGYSGGFKTIAIGAAGEQTINYTHGLKIIGDSRTRLGSIENNPFYEAVSVGGKKAGLKFIVNVVTNKEARVAAVMAGEPRAVFLELVKIAKKIYEVSTSGVFDAIVCGVEYPKGVNLYQASRAASYVFFSPRRLIRDKGIIIIAAPCEEGVGKGIGEKRFYELMTSEKTPALLSDKIKRRGIKAGEQRAFIMAKVLESCDVVIVGSACPEVVSAMHMKPALNMDEAFDIVKKRFGQSARVLIVPYPFHTVLT